jgi:hypothetical protein
VKVYEFGTVSKHDLPLFAYNFEKAWGMTAIADDSQPALSLLPAYQDHNNHSGDHAAQGFRNESNDSSANATGYSETTGYQDMIAATTSLSISNTEVVANFAYYPSDAALDFGQMDIQIRTVDGLYQKAASLLDTQAHANFITEPLAAKLGHKVQVYGGPTYATVCGSGVQPRGQIWAQWQCSRSSEIYKDYFLVIGESDLFDLVFGVETIHKRNIFLKNPFFDSNSALLNGESPLFNVLGLKPRNSKLVNYGRSIPDS